MRSFELARKVVNNEIVTEDGKEVLAYPAAQIPEYQTLNAAGADFFAAEEVVVPSIWKLVFSSLASKASAKIDTFTESIFSSFGYKKEKEEKKELIDIVPTLIHTGIKSQMEDDEVLELYNRSSNPKKLGLILANSVGK